MGMCGNKIRRLEIIIDGKIFEEVTEFKNLVNNNLEYKQYMEYKLQTCNRINGTIKRISGKKISNETKLRLHNITEKAALKYGSETWVLNKR
jgi:hypothetical protein